MRLRISLPLAAVVMAVMPACTFGQYYLQAFDSFDNTYDGGYQFGYQSGWLEGSDEGRFEGARVGTEEGYNFGYSSTYGPAYNASFTLHFSESALEGFNATYPVEFRDAFYAASRQGSGGWLGGILLNNFGVSSSAWDDGYDSGFELGHQEGYDAYFSIAYEPAYAAAVEPGRVDGRTDGRADGAAEGSSVGYEAGAELGRERGATDGRTFYYDDGNLSAWQADWDLHQMPYAPYQIPTPAPTDFLPTDFLPFASAQSVPEPSGSCIFFLSVLGLLLSRNRR